MARRQDHPQEAVLANEAHLAAFDGDDFTGLLHGLDGRALSHAPQVNDVAVALAILGNHILGRGFVNLDACHEFAGSHEFVGAHAVAAAQNGHLAHLALWFIYNTRGNSVDF